MSLLLAFLIIVAVAGVLALWVILCEWLADKAAEHIS